MAQLPKFKPGDTPIANYNQGAINWSYLMLKYGKPLGPDQKQYDPYYTYTIYVNLNGQNIEHRWYPSVDEHKLIQLAGAANNAQLAATYVVDNKRKGLVVAHVAGPKTERTQEQVDAEVEQELLKLGGGAQQPLSNVVLPPPQPTVPPPPFGAPAPQAPAVAQQPTTTTPPQVVPPPQPQPQQPLPQPQQQPPPPPQEYDEPEQKVFYPKKDDARYLELMGAVADDALALRKMAYDKAWKILEPSFPEKMSPAQQLEAMRMCVDFSAPVNMYLREKSWHMWEKNGVDWVLGKQVPTADTKEGALALINELHPSQYPPNSKTLISDWLRYVAQPDENIKSWKHAANICKVLGLDRNVLLDEYDVDHMLMLTQAIWTYEAAKLELGNRNDALDIIVSEFGLPHELMKYEELDEEETEEDE